MATSKPHKPLQVEKRLSSEAKMDLVRRIAWFWRPKEIVAFMKDQHRVDILPYVINQWRLSATWKPVIDKLREDYLKAIQEVPLANKKHRLEELQKLYEIHLEKKCYREAQSVIKDFRDECEAKGADVYNFTQINHTEFNEMTDEQIAQEKTKALQQLEKARRMKLISQGEESGQVQEIEAQEIQEIRSDEQV